MVIFLQMKWKIHLMIFLTFFLDFMVKFIEENTTVSRRTLKSTALKAGTRKTVTHVFDNLSTSILFQPLQIISVIYWNVTNNYRIKLYLEPNYQKLDCDRIENSIRSNTHSWESWDSWVLLQSINIFTFASLRIYRIVSVKFILSCVKSLDALLW